jgi:hypothetical protein
VAACSDQVGQLDGHKESASVVADAQLDLIADSANRNRDFFGVGVKQAVLQSFLDDAKEAKPLGMAEVRNLLEVELSFGSVRGFA